MDISDYIVPLVACEPATNAKKTFSNKAFTLDGKIKKCDNSSRSTKNAAT
jgi:hypothetical protein